MRIHKLGRLFGAKYSVSNELISQASLKEEVKREILNAYKLYVDGSSPQNKEPIIQMLANSDEPICKQVISDMTELVANLDHPKHEKLIALMQRVIDTLTPEAILQVREFIQSSTKGTNEAQRNHRERLKSKFEDRVKRLVGILSKMLGKERVLDRTRMPITKEKLLVFMRTPSAEKYGLDDMDVMTRLLSYPELREKITTLVNAIDRGHMPLDGPEIAKETAELAELFRQKQSNEPFLESNEEEAQRQMQMPAPETQVSRQMLERKKDLEFERSEQERAEQRDAETAEREKAFQEQQKDLDWERHTRQTNGSLSLQRLIIKYQGKTL